MTIKRLTIQTVLTLALALVAIAAAVWLSVQPSKIQGPGAIAVRPDGLFWLSVDRELWLITPQGDRLQTIDLNSPGLKIAPTRLGIANLSAPTNESVLVNFRGEASVYKLAAATGKLLATVKLRTSPHLVEFLQRAPTMTAAADGRLAFATGGGHTTLVFNADGTEAASTVEGTYRFTNGLWWAEEGLWTTDANRFALKRLDPNKATVLETIQLDANGSHRFLGVAGASLGGSRALGAPPPVATVVRLSEGMKHGKVVDVFADGSQRVFGVDAGNPEGVIFEARDLAWISAAGGTHRLVVVDGDTYKLRQFDAMGTVAGEFGNAEVKRALTSLKDRRGHLEIAHRLALGLGFALLALALLFAWRLSQLRREARLRALDSPETVMMEPRLIGKAIPAPLDSNALLGLNLQVFWPLYALAISLVVVYLIWPMGLQQAMGASGLTTSLPWVVGFGTAIALIAIWVIQYWLRARSNRPELEPLFNHAALTIVAGSVAVKEALKPGERPREACTLSRGLTTSLMVLTGERLMWFNINSRDQVLTKSAAITQVVQADTHPNPSAGLVGLMRRLGFGTSAELVLHFSDGSRLDATCASPLTLRRIVRAVNTDSTTSRQSTQLGLTAFETEFLDDMATEQSNSDFVDSGENQTDSGFATTRQEDVRSSVRRRALEQKNNSPQASQFSGSGFAQRPSAWPAALLSLVTPGAGQWLQGRFGTGLLMFVGWMVIMITATAPTLHAWINGTTDVAVTTLAFAVAASFVVQLLSAWDAWRMSPKA